MKRLIPFTKGYDVGINVKRQQWSRTELPDHMIVTQAARGREDWVERTSSTTHCTSSASSILFMRYEILSNLD